MFTVVRPRLHFPMMMMMMMVVVGLPRYLRPITRQNFAIVHNLSGTKNTESDTPSGPHGGEARNLHMVYGIAASHRP